MIDQSHNIEGKIDAMIQSVMNIQTAYAKALLVDEERLAAAQREGDVLGAHRVLLEAFETDVRPLLAACERASASSPIRSRRSAPAACRAAGARARHRVGRERLRANLTRVDALVVNEEEMTQRSAFVLECVRTRSTSTSKRTGGLAEMLAALREAGIRNYTIFRNGNEMFGYFESDDLDGRRGLHGGAGSQRQLAGRDGRAPRGARARRRAPDARRDLPSRLKCALRPSTWGRRRSALRSSSSRPRRRDSRSSTGGSTARRRGPTVRCDGVRQSSSRTSGSGSTARSSPAPSTRLESTAGRSIMGCSTSRGGCSPTRTATGARARMAGAPWHGRWERPSSTGERGCS